MLSVLFAAALTLRPGAVDVVLAPDAPKATQIAADEMTNFLGRVLGAPVPVVRAAAPGRTAITLDGTAADLPRDAFRIVIGKDGVRIEGRDSTEKDPESIIKLPGEQEWGPQFERATLFGVYEFLEKVAGCRFYFPGELGTIVPKRASLKVPFGTVTKKPFFTVRRYGYSDGRVPEAILREFRKPGEAAEPKPERWGAVTPVEKIVKRWHFYRLKMETEYLQCCHGLKKFRFLQRFGKTHPEYFCLGKDGKRMCEEGKYRAGLLCFSSAVTNEVYEDIKAYLQGKDVSTRYAPLKMSRWPLAFQGDVIDVMSQDDVTPCQCARCQAAYDFSRGPNYATEQIWDFTRTLVKRLNADGLTDFRLTQMSYSPYAEVPKDPLPTNVHVMVAVQGPWSVWNRKDHAAEAARIRAWKKTLGHKVWLWTYPGKAIRLHIPGPPTVSPRSWGEFYKREADDIYGAFSESETENWFHNYLNYYVFSRIAWNPNVDVAAVLDEHYRLMFGPAAREMKALYEGFEDKWVRNVASSVVQTPVGPVANTPSDIRLWTRVYSSDFMSACARLLDTAAAKVTAGSLEARRIALVREEYYEPLEKVRSEAMKAIEQDIGKPKLAQGHPKSDGKPFNLRPTNWRDARLIRGQFIGATVAVRREGKDLVIDWNCKEERPADVVTTARRSDDPDMDRDDSVELYLDITGDRETYYRFVVNRNGTLSDACGVKPRTRSHTKWDYSWNANARTKVQKTADGWTCELRIPLSAFPDYDKRIVANFCRNRILRGEPEVNRCYYWGPQYNYEDLRRYHTILIEE